MSSPDSVSDQYSNTDEPHAMRRKLILAAHPEIRDLMKPDRRVAAQIVIMSLIQLCLALYSPLMSWPMFFVVACAIGGTINHSLSLGLHEMSHHTAFGYGNAVIHNLVALICNLPLGVPAYYTFKKYHLDHHRYLGDEVYDTDIPSWIEVKMYSSAIGKLFFVLLQPLSYTLRPLLVNPKPILSGELWFWIIHIAFGILVTKMFGPTPIAYMITSTFLGLSLHPISGHFISEHYVFQKGFETYSYYGPLNKLTFNVGYHNEHHDFPFIPGYQLPKVKEIAPEFYDNLPHYNSWTKVIYDFITNPEISLQSRTKRKTKRE